MNKIERKQEVLIMATVMENFINDRMNECFKIQTDELGDYIHDPNCSWKLLRSTEFESPHDEEIFKVLQDFREAFETFVLKY